MAEIWFSSDTHINHENILKFTDSSGKKFRGDKFKNVQEMNEYIIEKHNSVVKPEDHWWCGGDVFFGAADNADSVLSRMNGKKRLIIGNHDNLKNKLFFKHFEKIVLWRHFKEEKVLLTHVPVHETSMIGKDEETLNVHGHIHQNLPPKGNYVCVCVEHLDYTPIHISKVFSLWKEQQDKVKWEK